MRIIPINSQYNQRTNVSPKQTNFGMLKGKLSDIEALNYLTGSEFIAAEQTLSSTAIDEIKLLDLLSGYEIKLISGYIERMRAKGLTIGFNGSELQRIISSLRKASKAKGSSVSFDYLIEQAPYVTSDLNIKPENVSYKDFIGHKKIYVYKPYGE